jgi:hypothetical protein
MAGKKTDESKSPTRPLTDEELERLTAPGTVSAAEEAFAAGASAGPVETGTPALAGVETQLQPPGDLALEKNKVVGVKAEALSQSMRGGVDRVSELRAELMAEIANLAKAFNDEIQALKASKVEDDGYLWTNIRGTIYCPECKCQMDGGSMTGQCDSPYTHPSGSAASKPCKYQGKKAEKPKVKIRFLP